ncbi:MAG: bifunctional diaminohydroxyphosphoribosylaminopyrimidine deaminase/5-amino-6-(5-phosphoribosylamino)uracil reductase RibD [Pirellulales bacterium]
MNAVNESDDRQFMQQALDLASRGCGQVEPNPMVGCVIVQQGEVVGSGFHAEYGGPHAEVVALQEAGDRAQGATLYVTLEPCCHQGKTPPCTDAVIRAGIARVVAAQQDPFPHVNGLGAERLRAAGIDVRIGVLGESARELNAPYRKLVQRTQPWVMAKWAMTWDGKLATRRRDSQWISCEASRQAVHQLRGRVDAIVVGIGTVLADDPLLTARPPGTRVARRVVVDWEALTPLNSKLVQSAHDVPVVIVVSDRAAASRMQLLEQAGCKVVGCSGVDERQRLDAMLSWMGRQRWTNVLVEGGSGLLGSLFDARAIDEVHVFIAPKLVGGAEALTPVGGLGLEQIATAATLRTVQWSLVDTDIYLMGRVDY